MSNTQFQYDLNADIESNLIKCNVRGCYYIIKSDQHDGLFGEFYVQFETVPLASIKCSYEMIALLINDS